MGTRERERERTSFVRRSDDTISLSMATVGTLARTMVPSSPSTQKNKASFLGSSTSSGSSSSFLNARKVRTITSASRSRKQGSGVRTGAQGKPTARPLSVASVDKASSASGANKQEGDKVVFDPSFKVDKETAKDIYVDMLKGRNFEDMCAQMYYRGKMFGFVHLYNGQEAVSTGVIGAMRSDDYVCSTYRDHVHAVSKGVPMRNVMAELFGKETGICRGQGGSMHMFSAEHNFLGGFAFIGEGIPVGAGAAFQARYKRDVLGDETADQVCASFFGDGTCNNGAFYETLNMASLYKLPCLFVVENNKWAIGMAHDRATAPTLGDKEPYSYRGHSLADPDELRKPEEKEFYAKRDPIPKFREYLIKQGLATEKELKEWEKQVEDEVEEAVEFADASERPGKEQLLENVFADPSGFGIAADGGSQSPNFP